MAISLESLQKRKAGIPPRVLFYSVPGLGKTLLGTGMPKPIFLITPNSEGGESCLPEGCDVPFWEIRTFTDFTDALNTLGENETKFQTLVIDSMTGLQDLALDHTEKVRGLTNIRRMDFGAGYRECADQFANEALPLLDGLRNVRKMTQLFLAHSTEKQERKPDSEPFTAYKPKIFNGLLELLYTNADALLFGTYEQPTMTVGKGKDALTRVVGRARRVIRSSNESLAYTAKNRWGLPPTIELPDVTPEEAHRLWATIIQNKRTHEHQTS